MILWLQYLRLCFCLLINFGSDNRAVHALQFPSHGLWQSDAEEQVSTDKTWVER